MEKKKKIENLIVNEFFSFVPSLILLLLQISYHLKKTHTKQIDLK